jgi:hypothetical protein
MRYAAFTSFTAGPTGVPVIGGLSRAAACKCGVRLPFNPRVEEALKRRQRFPLDSRSPEDPWDDDPNGDLVVRAAERWVIDAWRAERAVAPDLRGFISEHDGGDMVDLDSGEVVPSPQVGMGAL